MILRPPRSTLFPYPTLFRSEDEARRSVEIAQAHGCGSVRIAQDEAERALIWKGRKTAFGAIRSEEHTSELQSRQYLVCRLLLEKKKDKRPDISCSHTT